MEVRKKWRFPGSNLIALAEDPEMESFTRHAKAFDANGPPLTAWETQQSFSSFPGLENHIPPLSLFPIPLLWRSQRLSGFGTFNFDLAS